MARKTTYPDTPGWKGAKDTGRQAARAIAPGLARRQRQVLEAFSRFGSAGATCDQVAEMLGLLIYLVRPRASALERKGKLHPIGKRPGSMGHQVTVYSVVQHG